MQGVCGEGLQKGRRVNHRKTSWGGDWHRLQRNEVRQRESTLSGGPGKDDSRKEKAIKEGCPSRNDAKHLFPLKPPNTSKNSQARPYNQRSKRTGTALLA